MCRKAVLWLCLFLALAGTAMAGTKNTAAEQPPVSEPSAKELSGMSIVGNDEAPKALYIVPWKSSEIGVETSMNMMLNARDVPVDRDVFRRQLDFYELTTKRK
jgi:hypothetical protein